MLLKCVRKFLVVFRNSHVSDWWLRARCLNCRVIEGSIQKWRIITCRERCKVSLDFQVLARVIIGNWIFSVLIFHVLSLGGLFKVVKSNLKTLERIGFRSRQKPIFSRLMEVKASKRRKREETLITSHSKISAKLSRFINPRNLHAPRQACELLNTI